MQRYISIILLISKYKNITLIWLYLIVWYKIITKLKMGKIHFKEQIQMINIFDY